MALTYGPGEVAGAFYLNQQQRKDLERSKYRSPQFPILGPAGARINQPGIGFCNISYFLMEDTETHR